MHHAITWANGDKVLCHHMASLAYNELYDRIPNVSIFLFKVPHLMNAFASKLQPPYKMNSPNSQSISIIPGDIDNPKDRVRWSTTQLLLDRQPDLGLDLWRNQLSEQNSMLHMSESCKFKATKYAVWCCHNMIIFFLLNTHNRYPIAHMRGGSVMGCLLRSWH